MAIMKDSISQDDQSDNNRPATGDDAASEAARTLGRRGGLKGGVARALKLSPEERSEIAKNAVEARWAKSRGEAIRHPKATHTGVLQIGDISLPCAVLEDGARVFTQQGLLEAIGRHPNLSGTATSQDDQLPPFLRATNLRLYISKELEQTCNPILFRPITDPGRSGLVSGHRGLAYGYKVELLPLICHVYLDARQAGKLKSGGKQDQTRIAARCEMLIRGLATVGIIALVDEATGYQADRDRSELRRILQAYIARELLPWTERFPREFYQELFRLNGWKFDPMSVKRPRLVGKQTVELIYDKLPPGVLEELRSKNPVVYRGGTRKHRHHQFLTNDIGNPHLEKQVASVTALMRASTNWNMFKRLFDRAFPKRERQAELFPESEVELTDAEGNPIGDTE